MRSPIQDHAPSRAGRTRPSLSLAAGIGVVLLSLSPGPGASTTVDTLDNGLELILVENHSVPLIASTVYVKSGSAYESDYQNGITHLLEHLLFDGTTHLTREELAGSIQDLGGYLNAFTDKDVTGYLLVMPKDYIEYGLTVQADMLFNSIFPEEELEKERQVVIEEIRRAADQPEAPADAFFDANAYAGTGYERPVLGYRAFIENLPRKAIVDYWKSNYTPDNMVLLAVGDFETERMEATVKQVFGGLEPSARPAGPAEIHEQLAEAKQRFGRIVGIQRYDTVASVPSTYVEFSFDAPQIGEPDYLALDLLARYLNTDEISPLKQALQGGAEPAAAEVEIALVTRPDLSRLELRAIATEATLADSIVTAVLNQVTALAEHRADSTALAGVKTSARCEAIYDTERINYFSVMVASRLIAGGWKFVDEYPDLLSGVTWEDCRAAFEHWLRNPNCIITVTRPADSFALPFTPSGPGDDAVRGYFDTASFPEHDLSQGYDLHFPAADSLRPKWQDRAVYRREILDNGLTAIVRSDSGSQVFAVNVLAKNRSMCEPGGKAGITDFVNRCLEKGTTDHPGALLVQALGAIGARLTLCDNPWIPYDDRYTARSHAFVRFETIDDFAADGFSLLAETLHNPAFDSADVESVRAVMLGVIRQATTSPSQVARDLFYATLFENSAYGNPIMGTPESLTGITIDDLQRHHRTFYAPDNLIIAVSSSRDTAEVMGWVRTCFGGVPASGIATVGPSDTQTIISAREVHSELLSEQVAICAGGRLPDPHSAEVVDLQVAAEILSERLFNTLRERQGLAYAVGTEVMFDRRVGWYYLSIGAGTEKVAAARDGLELQTDKLAFDGPTAGEVRRAANQIWAGLLRAKTARINQAHYLALNEFLGRPVEYDGSLLQALAKVTPQSVRAAAARYFRPAIWVIASAGAVKP